MHNPSKGEISFFKLSRIIPYIFSTYAVSCCLKSRAGYLASTCLSVSTPPFMLPLIRERLTPAGAPRKLCNKVNENIYLPEEGKFLNGN